MAVLIIATYAAGSRAYLVGVVILLSVDLLIFAWGPELGMQRWSAFLLPVPWLGAVPFFMALYRLSALPDRYWEGTKLYPGKWSKGWVWLPVALAFLFSWLGNYAKVAAQVFPARSDTKAVQAEIRDWHFFSHENINGHEVVKKKLARMVRFRDDSMGVVVLTMKDGSKGLHLIFVHRVHRADGYVWKKNERPDAVGLITSQRGGCVTEHRPPVCAFLVPQEATRVGTVGPDGRVLEGSALNGVGVVISEASGDVYFEPTSWKAYDASGLLIFEDSNYAYESPIVGSEECVSDVPIEPEIRFSPSASGDQSAPPEPSLSPAGESQPVQPLAPKRSRSFICRKVPGLQP